MIRRIWKRFSELGNYRYSQSCLEAGADMDQMAEAVHMAAAVRAGATLIHSLQMHNAVRH